MAVKTEIREITPSEAHKLLEGNVNNRSIRQSRLEVYARDMKSGNWKFNGAPIILNGTTILDGQHRLLACIMANKPFKTVVVSGITDEAHKTIDVGLPRTMADELKWRGEAQAAYLASVLTLVWKYDLDLMATSPRNNPSRTDLWQLLQKRPEIRESVAARHVGQELRIGPSPLGATHHLIAHEHTMETANRFLAHLRAGVDYVDGDPCLTLRNYAITRAGNKSWRPTAVEWFAYCIKTANAWLLERPLKSIRWARIGDRREGFPQIIGRDEIEDEE